MTDSIEGYDESDLVKTGRALIHYIEQIEDDGGQSEEYCEGWKDGIDQLILEIKGRKGEEGDFILTKEELAEFAHQLWMNLTKYYARQDDEVEVSEAKLEYWKQNCWMSYDELSEDMKDKDRKQVDKFLG